MTDPRDPFASPTGGGAGNRDRQPSGIYCNGIAASSFEGLGNSGYMGSGGFRPPDLEFAVRRNACLALARYKLAGSPAPVPAPTPSTSSMAAVDYTPLIYLLAILIVVRVVL